MTLFNASIEKASALWRASGLGKTWLTRLVDSIANIPVPIGLSYPHGILYGWTLHEKLHNPEPETIAFFKKKIRAGDRIADIGANIGYYTLFFSDLVGEQGKVVAFEPSPGAFARLSRAARAKKNITLENRGVYSRVDTLRLYSQRKGDPLGSMMYRRGAYFDQVAVFPLREYPEQFTMAKIDVEGAEIEVLRGMKTRIPATLEVAGIFPGGIKKYFSEIEALGYSIYFIVEGGETVPYRDDISALLTNIYIEPTV